jgi:hypothetical protein
LSPRGRGGVDRDRGIFRKLPRRRESPECTANWTASGDQSGLIAGPVSKTLRRRTLLFLSPQRDHHARPNSRHRLRRPASGIHDAPRRRVGGLPSVLWKCRSCAGSPRGPRNSSSAAGSATRRFLPGVSVDTGPGPSATAGPTASPLAVRRGWKALVGAGDLRPGRRRRAARRWGGASADVCP